MPRIALLVLLLLPTLASANPALRPDGLVFDAVVAPDGRLSAPLYLTRRGEYFAELLLERDAAGRRPADLPFAGEVRVLRREKPVFTRDFSTDLGADQPAATLFRVTTDRELPLKTPLTLVLDGAGAPPAGATLRLQVRLKPNPGSYFLR
ncbi:MAG: hypothetical protein H6977_05705 [Gammaproteobacteria bacterium]|nr:hypothetical protein [Gammaproteobacteria bacterium]MCP5199484.1 hypothetical protein [Gammaproteobacteria bacterium]